LPEDQRKSGGFTWPPPQEGEVYDGLQGALALAVILSRAGYDVWNWENAAMLRALEWLYNEANFPVSGNNEWIPHLINYYYHTSFAAPVPANPGKNVGWSDWTHNSLSLTVNLKAFLEGPFNSGNMNTVLRDNGLLPLNQQFNIAPWNYTGAEAVDTLPPGVVDWVLVALRSSPETSDKTARAAFIKSDGAIVDLDGLSPLRFNGMADGNYYIVVYHRNHLAIMSNAAHSLNDSSSVYDFTTAQSQAYGVNPMKSLPNGAYGMIAGDGNSDGVINEFDRQFIWQPQNGTPWQYFKFGDFNLDGGIDALDLNSYWRINNGSMMQVPEAHTNLKKVRRSARR
jgi:hypothetical protein